MKKYLFGVATIPILIAGVFMVPNPEALPLELKGYTKTCSILPDGEYCQYCKCLQGRGKTGFGNYQCDDGSRPICVKSLDELKNEQNIKEKTEIEKSQKGDEIK